MTHITSGGGHNVLSDRLTGVHTSVKLHFRKAEVCEFDVTFIGYKHVVWLQVPKKFRVFG